VVAGRSSHLSAVRAVGNDLSAHQRWADSALASAPRRDSGDPVFHQQSGGGNRVLVSGFVLIDLVGLPGTVMTAGLLNITLALMIWAAVRGHLEPATALSPAAAPARPKTDWPDGSRPQLS